MAASWNEILSENAFKESIVAATATDLETSKGQWSRVASDISILSQPGDILDCFFVDFKNKALEIDRKTIETRLCAAAFVICTKLLIKKAGI